MADTHNTTVITAEVVRYDDPVLITERVAVAAFIAGYGDPTRRSYATDLRIFATWCHDHGLNLLSVKRAHLELFGRSAGSLRCGSHGSGRGCVRGVRDQSLHQRRQHGGTRALADCRG